MAPKGENHGGWAGSGPPDEAARKHRGSRHSAKNKKEPGILVLDTLGDGALATLAKARRPPSGIGCPTGAVTARRRRISERWMKPRPGFFKYHKRIGNLLGSQLINQNRRFSESGFRSCLFPEEDWGRAEMAREASETFAKKEAVKRHNSEVEHLRTAMTLASGALVDQAEA